MESIVIIALAVSAITFTVTTTSIFSWVREQVSRIHPKIEELIHCPWCLSFYVTLCWTRNVTFVFAIMTISGLCHYVLLRAYEPVQQASARRELEKINKDWDKSIEELNINIE